MGKNGKKVVCWNPACNGANHLLRDCPKADKAQRKVIAAEKWAEFQAKVRANVAEEKGQLYMQVQVEDIDELAGHQDDEEDGFVLFQAGDKNKPIVKEQVRRETLKPTYLYLDSLSSYHQVFVR